MDKNKKYINITKKDSIWKIIANRIRLYFFPFPAKIPPRILPIPIEKIVMVETVVKKLSSDIDMLKYLKK